MWRQPKTVWSVAFACVISFMGIGLVDPILKPHRRRPRRRTVAGLAALHELPGRHGRRHARHRLGLQPRGRQAHPAARPRAHHRRRRPRRQPGHRRRHRRLPRPVGPRQRPVHRHRPGHDRHAPPGARWGRRSSSTRPRSASASPPARCSAAGSAAISWRWPFFGVAVLMAIAFLATVIVLPGHARHRPPHQSRRAAARPSPPPPAHRRASRRCSTTSASSRCSPSRRSRCAMGAHEIGFIFFGWGAAPRHHVGLRRPAAPAPVRHAARLVGALPGFAVDPRRHGDLDRPQVGARRRRHPRRGVPRREQHPHHRDGHEGRAGRARGGLGRLQLRAVLRRRGRPLAGGHARREVASTCRSGWGPVRCWPVSCSSRPVAGSTATSTPGRPMVRRARTAAARPRSSRSPTPDP